jgi:hypothetical protein
VPRRPFFQRTSNQLIYTSLTSEDLYRHLHTLPYTLYRCPAPTPPCRINRPPPTNSHPTGYYHHTTPYNTEAYKGQASQKVSINHQKSHWRHKVNGKLLTKRDITPSTKPLFPQAFTTLVQRPPGPLYHWWMMLHSPQISLSKDTTREYKKIQDILATCKFLTEWILFQYFHWQ